MAPVARPSSEGAPDPLTRPPSDEEPPLRVIRDAVTWADAMATARKQHQPSNAPFNMVAMYNSYIDAIVLPDNDNFAAFSIPFDDHAVVRGHAVFDTATLCENRLYRHTVHMDRFVASARSAELQFPSQFRTGETPDDDSVKAKLTSILKTLARTGQVRNGYFRYILSAGPGGNFDIIDEKCTPAFYCVLLTAPEDKLSLGAVREFTMGGSIPAKPGLLATTKSNNYLLNSLGAKSSAEKGGHYGIWIDSGEILESSVRNVLFVFENGRVQTPPFEDADPGAAGLPASAQAPASRILRGCTIRRAVQIARELLAAGGGLGVEGAATAFRINEVVVAEKMYHPAVWEAHGGLREMVLFSGDIGVDAVVEWDGRVVGDGKPGPVARAISERIFEEARGGGTEWHEEIF